METDSCNRRASPHLLKINCLVYEAELCKLWYFANLEIGPGYENQSLTTQIMARDATWNTKSFAYLFDNRLFLPGFVSKTGLKSTLMLAEGLR